MSQNNVSIENERADYGIYSDGVNTIKTLLPCTIQDIQSPPPSFTTLPPAIGSPRTSGEISRMDFATQQPQRTKTTKRQWSCGVLVDLFFEHMMIIGMYLIIMPSFFYLGWFLRGGVDADKVARALNATLSTNVTSIYHSSDYLF